MSGRDEKQLDQRRWMTELFWRTLDFTNARQNVSLTDKETLDALWDADLLADCVSLLGFGMLSKMAQMSANQPPVLAEATLIRQ